MASLCRRFLSKPLQKHCISSLSYQSQFNFTSSQQQDKLKDASSSLKHVLKISDLTFDEINKILLSAKKLKKSPLSLYNKTLENQTLLMLFEKASLRTRVSFEVGMHQLGGHAIFYSIANSPLGEKETFGDTGACLSRYCSAIMARLNKREHLRELSTNSQIPVINALDDNAHPCQMLADLLTISEHKATLSYSDLKFTYFGDIRNNVTYDLMRLCTIMGFKECYICGPISCGNEYNIEQDVINECNQLNINNGCKLVITDNVSEAASNSDIIYTDSWMSYGILKELQEQRIKIFESFQVTNNVMKLAKDDCIFMNCLPAMRGLEQTQDVIDGNQSVVFDQAENRLHAQKALLLYLINGNFNDNNGN